MSIPPAFLDELRARTTLSSLVSRSSVPIKKAGREWKAPCPFHQEKTPSFYVNDEKAFYHCFGCQAHGDAISWLVQHDGMQFVDAVKTLAEMAGLEMPAPDPRAAERNRRRDSFVDILARAQRFFAVRLDAEAGDMDASAAALYLSDRGIGGLAIQRFGIGFAPNSRPGQPSPMVETLKDVDGAELERLGLVKRNPDSGRAYDFFRRRIMIPIHDARGNVIGFGGRIVGAGEPKYLNSPDTPVFDKGRTLFNLHRVAPAARAKGQLLIVEGYMDVIGLDSVGFDTAVAPNGTALTEHQLFLAWKLVDAPTVCFDGDSAGRKAAARAAYRALPVMEAGKSLRFASLPEGKDPDDMAREQGLEAVTAMVEAAVPLVDVIWRDLLERFDMRNPDQRAAMSAEIKRTLATIRDVDVRESYRDALLTLYRGAGSRSRAASNNHQSRGRGRNVAIAVEGALILGIVDRPAVLEAHSSAIERLPWKIEEHARLAKVLSDAAWVPALNEEPFTRDQALEAIEKAGLTEYVAFLRRETLRMPFATETDPSKAESMLVAALRDNFT